MNPAVALLVKNFKPKYDDDSIDRLNYAYTCGLILIALLVIGSKQYIGEPLQCWMNAEFRPQWENYIESYCYMENTYYVSENHQLPSPEKRQDLELKYYQWVYWYLIILLFFCWVPKGIWKAFSWKNGLNVSCIITNIKNVKNVSINIINNFEMNDIREDRFMGVFPKRVRSSYLTSVYLLCKLLNFLNNFTQLYIMNKFLNTSYTFWGIGILNDLISNRDWTFSGNFPRVTYCDFMRRDDTSSKPMLFTVQCVLMINEFNEKLFIVLWFWFLGLTILNFANLVYWLIISFVPAFSQQYIKAQMLFSPNKLFDKDDVAAFIADTLSTDSVTAIRLVSSNAGDVASSDLIDFIYSDWKNFKIQEQEAAENK